MTSMKAYRVSEPGGPEKLIIATTQIPEPKAGEILIKVAAVGLNRADLLQRQGFYPPPPGASDIVGLEVSGTVSQSLSPLYSIGDQVCALLSGGGYAEYVTVSAEAVLPVPQGVSLIDAAALPEVAATVWANIFMQEPLRSGELFLMHGGASGIGTHAIQVARHFGAKVAVTAGSQEKLDICRQLGAEITINYTENDFADILANQVDVILDLIGAKYLSQNITALTDYGRLRIIGLQGGIKAELNIAQLQAKKASITATTLRSRPLAGPNGKAAVITAVKEHIWPAITSGAIKPYIAKYFPFDQAATAHELFESGTTSGKILLTL